VRLVARIVVFGASGRTGRGVVESLVAAGSRPVVAGRSAERVRALASSHGLEWVVADARRPASVRAAVGAGDVLVATVGPFARWGAAAVKAAIEAGGIYLDSTGEPAFIRRVFEDLDAPARRAGAALLTAMGHDWVPGALAGALALRDAGQAAVIVDVGTFVTGLRAGDLSRGTRESLVGAALDGGHAYRDGAVRHARAAERRREFVVDGRPHAAVSVGGAEHFTLPSAFPQLREVGVYAGGAGALTPALQAGALVAEQVARLPGVPAVLRAAGERMARAGGSGAPRPGARTRVVAIAAAQDGTPLAEARLAGGDPYTFTAGLLAWAARRAAGGEVRGTGALGPVGAFGLDALERGCAEAGLSRESS
jgi:short subunit dehydrogenase-like uncharacterized protein